MNKKMKDLKKYRAAEIVKTIDCNCFNMKGNSGHRAIS